MRPTRPVTLVTGASNGLGKATALALDATAGPIVVSSHSAERAEVTAEEIRRNGGEVSVVAADLLDRGDIEALVAEVVAIHDRLDHLVASGAATSKDGLHWNLFHETDPSDFAGLVNAHWLSKAYLIRAALPHMIESGYGKVVNISSDAGKVPTPHEALLGGAAAGVMLMTRVLAREVGRYGVRLNTITMGPLADVDMARVITQLQDDHGAATEDIVKALRKRMLFPVSSPDIAAAVTFLLGPGGDNVTGQSWSVNGGVSTT